jgi:hypothetical protein
VLPFLLGLLSLLLGCAAPHDNPKDPLSPRYTPEQPAPYVPDFESRVWSEHFPVGQVSEIYQVRTEFYNPDTSFALDSVWVIYDGWLPLGLRSDSTGVWGTNFDQSVFGCGQQMACVMGEPFNFYAHHGLDSVYGVGPLYLFRVIATAPATDEPDSGDTVNPFVMLQWSPFSANFGFSFRANLVRTDTAWTWISTLLPRDQYLVYPAPDSLADGNYYWTLSVVDSFGNSSRSQKAYFNVSSSGAPE